MLSSARAQFILRNGLIVYILNTEMTASVKKKKKKRKQIKRLKMMGVLISTRQNNVQIFGIQSDKRQSDCSTVALLKAAYAENVHIALSSRY